MNAEDPVGFPRTGISDGDIIDVGPNARIRVLATPGHTFTHVSYALEDRGTVSAVFTGGSLLFGSTGRPDLVGPEHTVGLAHRQYASARRLATELPPETRVLPTHGFGSFCASTESEATESTIGAEAVSNPVLTQDEERYVAELLAGLDAFPAYYARIGPVNLAGPHRPDLSPSPFADAQQLRRRLGRGEWLVDLRSRTAFAAGHARGTLNFGLDGSFASYLGWLIPWGTPVTLLGDDADQIAEAQRELVRIGIDRPAAAATGGPQNWTVERVHTGGLGSFADLAGVRVQRAVEVLDVRRNTEWAESHIAGARHIPLHELLDRVGEIPREEIWVHCSTGYRASIAGSILLARGHHAVVVDDDFENASAAGLT